VTSAIGNSELRWPGGKRITINLASADVRKQGPSFDLPDCPGLPDLDGFYLTGELALSGQLRPLTKGIATV
jgi:magnesium chelatase family protein